MLHTIPWQAPSTPLALPELTIDPERTALLIVDMQQYSGQAERVVANNVRLLEYWRARGLPVVFLRVGSLLPDARDQHAKRRISWGRAEGAVEPFRCPLGTPGYEVRSELAPLPTELVLDKNGTGAFSTSAIDLYLRNLGVQNLVVTGVSTNHCVDTTARDAADRGYNVVLVEDACADSAASGQRATMSAIARHFGVVRSTDEVLGLFTNLLTPEPAGVR
jgi:nicotinamidase-related amidase